MMYRRKAAGARARPAVQQPRPDPACPAVRSDLVVLAARQAPRRLRHPRVPMVRPDPHRLWDQQGPCLPWGLRDPQDQRHPSDRPRPCRLWDQLGRTIGDILLQRRPDAPGKTLRSSFTRRFVASCGPDSWRTPAESRLRPHIQSMQNQPMERARVEELQALYGELHWTCERAATALRLACQSDAPADELLSLFRREEARAADLWRQIRSFGHLDQPCSYTRLDEANRPAELLT